MATFYVGDPVRIPGTITVGTVLTDPTTLSLTVRTPAGVSTTYTYALAQITRTATGLYEKIITATEPGVWSYSWISTGTAADVQPGSFVVRPTVAALSAHLTDLSAVRESLAIPAGDTDQDALITSLIGRASDALQSWAQREFVPRSTALKRTFRANGGYVSLAPYDLRTTTQVALDHDTTPIVLATTEYILFPDPAPDGVYGWLTLPGYITSVNRAVSVTGDWGWLTVPESVEQACIITVASWLRRDVPTLDLGSDEPRETTPAAALTYGIPGAAKALLRPFCRPAAVG